MFIVSRSLSIFSKVLLSFLFDNVYTIRLDPLTIYLFIMLRSYHYANLTFRKELGWEHERRLKVINDGIVFRSAFSSY